MSGLEQEIRDAIAKSMPAQVGDVLKERLEQGSNDAKEVRRLERLISLLEDRDVKRVDKMDSLERVAQDHVHLEVREEKVLKREQEAALLELKVEMWKEVADTTKDLARIMFRNTNTQYVSNTSGYVDVPDPRNPGCTLQQFSNASTTTDQSEV